VSTSATIIVRIAEPVFPAASTLRYSIVNVPVDDVSTNVPQVWNDPLAPYIPVRVFPVPSILSVQVAPEST
jgi:hypothetical protein